MRKSEDVVNKPVHYPFWFGGSASCCATLFTHPLDLGKLGLSHSIRYQLTIAQSRYFSPAASRMTSNSQPQVRLQTQAAGGVKLNMSQMFAHIAKTDGISGLYRGVRTPSLNGSLHH